MMYSSEMLSPREMSASRRWLPFGESKRPDEGRPAWMMCGGLVAAASPGKKRYVQWHDLYGVEWDEARGRYVIASYWVESPSEYIQKPYALGTLRRYSAEKRLIKVADDLTYHDIEEHLSRRYPLLEMPSQSDFWMQFGVPFFEEVDGYDKSEH